MEELTSWKSFPTNQPTNQKDLTMNRETFGAIMYTRGNAAFNRGKIAESDDRFYFVDAHLSSAAPFRPSFPAIEGKNAYHVDGEREGKISDGAVNGSFVRLEEWQSEPWSKEDREAYYCHRKEESERRQEEVRRINKAYSERERLRRGFAIA